MIGLLILAGYLFCWLCASVVIVRHETGPRDDATDRALLGVAALLSGAFWPLAAPVALILWLAKHESRAERRDRLAVERDKQVREMRIHIAKLERELGIGRIAS